LLALLRHNASADTLQAHAARYSAVVKASVAHLAAQPKAPPVSFAALLDE
jgi:hypothetical protein